MQFWRFGGGWVHTQCGAFFFSFFNGIPYMTESGKKRAPSVWAVSLASLRGSASRPRLGLPLSGPCRAGSAAEAARSASVVCACRQRLACGGDAEMVMSPGRKQPAWLLPSVRPLHGLPSHRTQGLRRAGSLCLYVPPAFDFSWKQLGLPGFWLVLKSKAGPHRLAPSSSGKGPP